MRWKSLPHLALAVVLLGMSVYYYRDTIGWFPSHIHGWTQSDRLALAYGYLDNGLNFFKPQTYNLETREGVTGVDFPIHEYIVAALMQLFGREPGVFRGYVLMLSLIGYLFLYRLGHFFTGSWWLGLAGVVFAFTCPVITYYQNGFIPSSTAFAAALAGYFYYFRYLENDKAPDLYRAVGLLALAALVRMPFHIFLFATLLQQGARRIKPPAYIGKAPAWRPFVLAYGAAYAAVAAALTWKTWLNTHYGSRFLTALTPPETLQELWDITRTAAGRWWDQYFTPYHYFLLAAALGFLLYRRFGRGAMLLRLQPALAQALLMLGGAALFYLLMARQYVDHEYYFTDSFYLGFIVLWLLGLAVQPFKPADYVAPAAALVLALAGGFWYSKDIQDEKYTDSDWNRGEITRKNYTGADRWLDSLGVAPGARILVIDAYSTNAPLLLMNRKGYTLLTTSRAKIEEALQLPFDYVTMQDVFLFSDVVANFPDLPQRLTRVAGNGRIGLYQRRPDQQAPDKLAAFIGMSVPDQSTYWDFEGAAPDTLWRPFEQVQTTRARSGSRGARFNADIEYGPGIQFTYTPGQTTRLLFDGYFFTEKAPASLLAVVSVEHNGAVAEYQKFPLNIPETGVWTRCPALFELPPTLPDGAVVKFYLWNLNRAEVYADDIGVERERGRK